MNRSKKITLFTLTGLLLAVCLITFAVSRYEEKKENIKNSDEILLTVSQDSVTSLSWEYEDTSLAFHKDETWLWDDDSAFPVDEEKIEELLEPFEEFGVSFRIEDVEDYSQYGLDAPQAEIRLTADGEEIDIKLGNFSTLDSERYVSIGDGNVYLVKEDPLETFELTIEDLIQNDQIPDVSEAKKIVFSGAENETVTYDEDGSSYCEDDVYFTDGKPLDTDNVEYYLSSISSLSTDTYVTYNASQEDLAAYGLDAPELTVTVTYPADADDDEDQEESAMETVTISVGRNQEELAAAKESGEEDAEEDVSAYFRVGDSKIVYPLSAASYKKLMAASYDDLRHEEIVTVSLDDVYQIDITLEGENYSLTSHASEEDEDTLVWDCGETEDVSVSGIKSAITALSTTEFTDQDPTGTGKEEIRFTIYFSQEDEGDAQMQVVLYRYNGDKCLVQVDGQTVALISRSKVVDLIEAVNAIVLG